MQWMTKLSGEPRSFISADKASLTILTPFHLLVSIHFLIEKIYHIKIHIGHADLNLM